MSLRRTRLLLVLATFGCAMNRNASSSAAVNHDWGTAVAQAEVAVSGRRYADADRLLADFASQNPGTEGAVESLYWRGLIELEPANRDGSPSTAAALFEAYNKVEGALPHRIEADILRHLAQRIQDVSAAATVAAATSPAMPAAQSASSADLKAKDTEIQRLKDELAKANDELERIKRRLTAPTKP